MAKPDEIPVKVQRVLGSSCWDLPDFAFGWYWKMLFKQADAENGLLPSDAEKLWRIAGARSKDFFLGKITYRSREGEVVVLERGGMSLVDRYFRRTDDGAWIYNPHMREVLQNTEPKAVKPKAVKQEKREIYMSISALPINEIYNSYPVKRSRDKALKAIEKAIQKIARERQITDLDAAEFLHKATLEFAKSPAGNKGKYTPYPATWFNSGDYLSDRAEWYRENESERQTGAQGRQARSFENIRAATERRLNNLAGKTNGHAEGGFSESGVTRIDSRRLPRKVDGESETGREGQILPSDPEGD